MTEFDWLNTPDWDEGVYRDPDSEEIEVTHYVTLEIPDEEIPTLDTPIFDPPEDFLSER